MEVDTGVPRDCLPASMDDRTGLAGEREPWRWGGQLKSALW